LRGLLAKITEFAPHAMLFPQTVDVARRVAERIAVMKDGAAAIQFQSQRVGLAMSHFFQKNMRAVLIFGILRQLLTTLPSFRYVSYKQSRPHIRLWRDLEPPTVGRRIGDTGEPSKLREWRSRTDRHDHRKLSPCMD